MSKYIKNFQAKFGLTADGLIGKKTLNKIKEVYNLTNEQVAHFMGQAHHESGGFSVAYENLNYSYEGLLANFSKYFDAKKAKEYAKKPEKIANWVYANRMGNGNEASGMGYKFRGRGSLQLTGYNNYKAFSDFIGKDCVANPDLVAEEFFFESAIYYFRANNLLPLCKKVDDATILGISRAVNLGNYNSTKTPKHLEDRKLRTNYYYNLLK